MAGLLSCRGYSNFTRTGGFGLGNMSGLSQAFSARYYEQKAGCDRDPAKIDPPVVLPLDLLSTGSKVATALAH